MIHVMLLLWYIKMYIILFLRNEVNKVILNW